MKKKSKNLVTTTRVTLVVAILSLIISVLTLLWVSAISDSYLTQAKMNADSTFDLYVRSARHDVCIEHAIKPCTQDTIKQFFEN